MHASTCFVRRQCTCLMCVYVCVCVGGGGCMNMPSKCLLLFIDSEYTQPTSHVVATDIKPDNYLVRSVIAILCCCWVCGIIALVNSIQVSHMVPQPVIYYSLTTQTGLLVSHPPKDACGQVVIDICHMCTAGLCGQSWCL
jgi:hypothetical protein